MNNYVAHIRKTYAQLAKKYGTTVEEMEDMCKAPIEFTKFIIANKVSLEEFNAYLPAIRINNFGVFYVSERRKSYINNYRMEKIRGYGDLYTRKKSDNTEQVIGEEAQSN